MTTEGIKDRAGDSGEDQVGPEDKDDIGLDPDEAPAAVEAEDEEEFEDSEGLDDYAEPFESRSFGGEFVWAEGDGFTCKILRVRAGEKVLVSTRGRKDMTVMLTGGRAILEVLEGDEVDRVEMLPAAPIQVHPEREHRLVAITEVEMFTVYSPLEQG